MALGATNSISVFDSLKPGVPGSSGAGVAVLHDDVASLPAAGTRYTPRALDDADLHWVSRGDKVTRCWLTGKIGAAATVTTSPAGVLIGAKLPEGGEFADGVWPDGTRFFRLDNADPDATPTTVTIVAAAAGLVEDDGVRGPRIGGDSGFDLLGCDKFCFIPTTAASVSAGAVIIEALAVN